MQSRVHLQPGGQFKLVFEVDVLLRAVDVALADEGVQRVLLPKVQFQRQRAGRKQVPRHVVATAHKVSCVGRKVDVELGRVVFNAGLVERREPRRGGLAVFSQFVAEIHPGVEVVDAVRGGGVPEHARADFTVPAGAWIWLRQSRPKSMVERSVLRRNRTFPCSPPRSRPSRKRAEIHPVAGSDAPIQFGVEVVEVVRRVGAHTRVVARRCSDDGTQQQVEVGPAGADHEAGLVLHNRAFQGQLRGDHADVAVA